MERWTYPIPSQLKTIEHLQYYLYQLTHRPNQFNPLACAGRLTQQFYIHAYKLVEDNRMNFRSHQSQFRFASYKGLLDHCQKAAGNNSSYYKQKEK